MVMQLSTVYSCAPPRRSSTQAAASYLPLPTAFLRAFCKCRRDMTFLGFFFPSVLEQLGFLSSRLPRRHVRLIFRAGRRAWYSRFGERLVSVTSHLFSTALLRARLVSS
jgi:hypothetical protein